MSIKHLYSHLLVELDAPTFRRVPSLVFHFRCRCRHRRNRIWNQVLCNTKLTIRKCLEVAQLLRLHGMGPRWPLRPRCIMHFLRHQDFNQSFESERQDCHEQSSHDSDPSYWNRGHGCMDSFLRLQSPLANVMRLNGAKISHRSRHRHSTRNLLIIHLDR